MLHLPGESSDPATSLQDLLDAWTAPREMSDSVCASCSQLTSSQQVTFISSGMYEGDRRHSRRQPAISTLGVLKCVVAREENPRKIVSDRWPLLVPRCG